VACNFPQISMLSRELGMVSEGRGDVPTANECLQPCRVYAFHEIEMGSIDKNIVSVSESQPGQPSTTLDLRTVDRWFILLRVSGEVHLECR